MRRITTAKQMKNKTGLIWVPFFFFFFEVQLIYSVVVGKTGLCHRSRSDILGRRYPLSEVISLFPSSLVSWSRDQLLSSILENTQFEVLCWNRLPVVSILRLFSSCKICMEELTSWSFTAALVNNI